MTTTLEALATGEKYDPEILLPNIYSSLLRTTQTLCPCGNTASVRRDGVLGTHEPASTWTTDGKRRPVIQDAYGIGSTCRYSGRTVTLAAALERDNALTPAEQRARDVTLARLESGITNTAPEGYALPKPVATLFALAEANGWMAQQAWAPYEGGFRLSARVSRPAGEGRGWLYDLAYFVAPGVARRTPFGLCSTPDRPSAHDTPSLKAITTVIRANPVPTEG
jgi:hypothetical protein